MTQHRRVCGELARLLLQLDFAALEFVPEPGDADPWDVQRRLRCTLEAHSTGDHYAFVMELDGVDTGSVWTRWAAGRRPAMVQVLPDCDAIQAGTQEPCCEFGGHPGAHTYELDDPWHASAGIAEDHHQ